MSMQVQACKDKASTSVMVVTLTITLSQHGFPRSTIHDLREEHDRFQCGLNHRDELDRSTLDLDSR